jgi:hypothetical protein
MQSTRSIGGWRTTLAAVAMAAALTASASADPAAPGGYAGAYQSPKLAVTLTADGDAYTGTIHLGQSQFPLAAKVEGGRLHGTFQASGASYPFDATLDGTKLTLTTGGTTYTLSDDNPLDPPGGRAAATAAPAPAPAAAPVAAGNIVGKWTVAGDLGNDKFTITFGADGGLTVETDSGSSSSGTNYKYADGKVTFDGSSQMNALIVGGTWPLTWQSADAFTTVDSNGKTLSFHRAPAK